MIVICREMGWDYYTYMSQPVFFIEAVHAFLLKEQRAQMEEIKKSRMKHG